MTEHLAENPVAAMHENKAREHRRKAADLDASADNTKNQSERKRLRAAAKNHRTQEKQAMENAKIAAQKT
ncbi:MAG TPA: hypothetical protein VKY85_15935 [Candidatus Angelobacter sp.]|nr:hypothetical protein [Candidatus Angelobacter sp.]